MEKMYAITYAQYGEPSVLQYGLHPIPSLKEGELLLFVMACGFNPSDAALRKGDFGNLLSFDVPHIPGVDVAGIVKTTKGDAPRFQEGQRVYGHLSIKRPGACAQYVVVKESEVDLLPETMSFEEAASLPLPFLTAHLALLDKGALAKGQRVLINGATGGVGLVALQLAKEKDAVIYATASKESLPLLEGQGIEKALDYKTAQYHEEIKEPLDLIVNFAPLTKASLGELASLLKEEGLLVSSTTIPETKDALPNKFLSIQARPDEAMLHELSKKILSKDIHGVTTQTFSLKEVPKVHTLHEEGALHGKTVIVLGTST